jgi:hypothetical protein
METRPGRRLDHKAFVKMMLEHSQPSIRRTERASRNAEQAEAKPATRKQPYRQIRNIAGSDRRDVQGGSSQCARLTGCPQSITRVGRKSSLPGVLGKPLKKRKAVTVILRNRCPASAHCHAAAK